MVAAKCQQTQLWNRFAKTAAPCDDTDSMLNAQWHGKCLLVVSRHHQLTPLIAALPWLCPVSPAVVHLLFRRRHWHSGRIIREMQQHMDMRGRFNNEFLHVCVQYMHREHHLVYLSLICCLYRSVPRSSWKCRAFWRLQEQTTKHSQFNLAMQRKSRVEKISVWWKVSSAIQLNILHSWLSSRAEDFYLVPLWSMTAEQPLEVCRVQQELPWEASRAEIWNNLFHEN